VNDISDASIMSALGRQMTVAVAKQLVSAGNLANVDTPGYRTREVALDDLLEQQLRTPASLTADGQQESADPVGLTTREAAGLPVRRDGNNVQLDRELLSMSRASADFSAAQTALAAKFCLIRYAINEVK
jgi:flagellar basal-body rod protein FlgB